MRGTTSLRMTLCFVSCFGVRLACGGGELAREGVEREAAEKVATHAALHLVEAAGGLFDPLEGEGLDKALEFGAKVGVAEKLGGAGLEEEDVFEQEG